MPELPEVQTVVSQLGDKLVGKTIASVWSEWPKSIRPSFEMFEQTVIGKRVTGSRRFGKHIIIDLSGGVSLVIHLKMTGHLLVKTPENRENEVFQDSYNQYLHHKIFFTDETELAFSDMRKFGWMETLLTSDVETMPSIAMLGIDALSDLLTKKVFVDLLKARKKAKIGTLLLEQNRIAGIGNIYRSEALFRAGILPERISETLTEKESGKLLKCVRRVLQDALSFRGMSDGDFRDTDGLPGAFQKELGVYGRNGLPCPKCGTMIRRIKLGQRSVFFCSLCQK